METFDVIIVGGGPAGMATALSLCQTHPAIAERTVILEKHRHPRPKLCGGALTFLGYDALAAIGISVDDIDLPHTQANAVQLRFGEAILDYQKNDVLRIYERQHLDAYLAQQVRASQVEMREETSVHAIERVDGGMLVTTNHGQLRASVVVGADGAAGVVRRAMDLPDQARICRLLEIISHQKPTADIDESDESDERTVLFDFSPFGEGLQGYYWSFPGSSETGRFMNRGVFDSRIISTRQRAKLKEILNNQLADTDAANDTCQIQGAPLRWWDPGTRISNPNMLLVGDAAGADPLMGEGISFALMYGPVAAQAIGSAMAEGDFSFTNYAKAVAESPVGQYLSMRVSTAKHVYDSSPANLLDMLS